MLAAAHPLTPARFADLETLFAGKGCSFARSCWCMAYRISGRFQPAPGQTAAQWAKAQLEALAASPLAPGLIGYDDAGAPVGWISLGPREHFAKLQRSPVMKPLDDAPVWSVVCFVVPGPQRGKGVAQTLLAHAIDFARANGATTLEAYPVDKPGRSQDQWLWHGTKAMFDRAGFQEVARRKPERPLMRLQLTPD